jgi:hypothetical protein
LWLPTHGDAKAGGEIGVREIETSFTFLRYRDRGDSGIDPAVLNGVQQASEVVVELAKREGNLQLVCDSLPQIDAQSTPLPFVAPKDEGRHAHRADDDLGPRLARVNVGMDRRRDDERPK